METIDWSQCGYFKGQDGQSELALCWCVLLSSDADSLLLRLEEVERCQLWLALMECVGAEHCRLPDGGTHLPRSWL